MIKGRLHLWVAAAVSAGGLLLGSGANAALIHHFDHDYTTVTIALNVYDGQPGGRYLWEYSVANISFDPAPGTTNGFSGFELYLPSPIAEIADITAPGPGIADPGWETNCCSGLPLEWDIRNSDGFGVMPGEIGIFSFTTDPRLVAINDTGWFHSWASDAQMSIVSTIGMHVPLVPGLTPIPLPGTISLLGLGLAALGLWTRKRASS